MVKSNYRLQNRGKEVPKATKLVTKLFPNKVTIHMPQDDILFASWKKQLDQDGETLKVKGNVNYLWTVLNRMGLECEGLDSICIKDQTLTIESMYSLGVIYTTCDRFNRKNMTL